MARSKHNFKNKKKQGKVPPAKGKHTYNSKAIDSIFGPIKKQRGSNDYSVGKKKGSSPFDNKKKKNPKGNQFEVLQQPTQKYHHPGQTPKHGSSNNNKKKAHKKKAPKVNNAVRKFKLQLPIVHPNSAPAPWWIKNSDEQASYRINDVDADNKCKFFNCISIHKDSLSVLDEELKAFADYVRLSRQELQARYYLIRTIQYFCKSLWEVEPDQCQIFGSFAAQSVCTFESDVDMAIWGVVPVEEESENDWQDNDNHKRRRQQQEEEEAAEKPAPIVHPNQRKQAKIQKWKAALDAHYKIDLNMDEKTTKDDDQEETSAKDEVARQAASQKATDLTTNAAVPGESSAAGDDVELLFVIDRAGDPVEELPAEEIKTVTSKEPSGQDLTTTADGESAQAKTVSEDSIEGDGSSSQFDDADDPEVVIVEQPNEESKGGNYAASHQFDDAEEDESSIPVLDDNHDDGEESDNDSADKLEGLKRRSRAFSCDSETRLLNLPDTDEVYHSTHASASEVIDVDAEDDEDDDDDEVPIVRRPRGHSVISLSSSTSGSEKEEEWDSSGMEVSFVTMPTAARPPQTASAGIPIGPTGETRKLIVRKLNLLQKWLRKTGAIEQSHVRKHAKVPIVNMSTYFGYECDIAIGGHNGTDTSSYATSQIERFKSFSTVVLFLKVLLCQHELDKPFSGGLGSFKLYVLVANHIERHLELGGSDSPGEILLTFLFRYGDVPGFQNANSHARTELSQLMVISCGDGCADMGSVFQVQNCVTVFGACWSRLQSKLKRRVNPEHSLLRFIVDPSKLESRRSKCMAKARLVKRFVPRWSIPKPDLSTAPIFSTTPPHATLSSGGTQSKPSVLPKKPPQNIQHPMARRPDQSPPEEFEEYLCTDDEAEQLKAGYGESSRASKSSAKKKSKKRKRSRSKESRKKGC